MQVLLRIVFARPPGLDSSWAICFAMVRIAALSRLPQVRD